MAARTDDCTPAARVTKSLLGYGVLAGIVYVLGSVIDGLLRPGFDFAHDSWSLLSLGDRGWLHINPGRRNRRRLTVRAVGAARRTPTTRASSASWSSRRAAAPA